MSGITYSWSFNDVDDKNKGDLLCCCIFWFLYLSPFGLFSIFRPIHAFYAISLIFTPSSLTNIFPVWYRVRGARSAGWGGVGGHMGGVETFVAS